ncbi:type I-E CRISPR-associated protein Cas6/Cse3/CasE [Streptomyces sp. NPDC060020]
MSITSFSEGIGRGKAYGCGLLSIAPAHAAAAT